MEPLQMPRFNLQVQKPEAGQIALAQKCGCICSYVRASKSQGLHMVCMCILLENKKLPSTESDCWSRQLSIVSSEWRCHSREFFSSLNDDTRLLNLQLVACTRLIYYGMYILPFSYTQGSLYRKPDHNSLFFSSKELFTNVVSQGKTPRILHFCRCFPSCHWVYDLFPVLTSPAVKPLQTSLVICPVFLLLEDASQDR